MNDPFRIYMKVKVKEGQLDNFLPRAANVIEYLKKSAPEMLQFEVFANHETNEVVWLESFKQVSSYDLHLANFANPEMQELTGKAMQLQESIESIYVMGEPSETAKAAFKQFGMDAKILSPWPGTIRLAESREENNIQSLVTMQLSDMAAYRKISEQVESAAETQSGVLFHRSYQMNDNEAVAFEEYSSSASLLEWVPVALENLGDFTSLVQGMTYEVFGTPSQECKTALDEWGAKYYKRHAGFVRFE